MSNISSQKGFSILIALGSIGVLMIIVIGMVQVFLTEMKLSRYQYDYILSSEQVEGAFEYAMLKIANHRDGFQDELTETDVDQTLFSGSSDRTRNNKISYTILAQTGAYSRVILPGEYLIFPLFSGNDFPIEPGKPSKLPTVNTGSVLVEDFRMSLSASPENIFWNIIAMSGTENISLSGTGEINGLEIGTSRFIGVECINNLGKIVASVNGICPIAVTNNSGEVLQYFYDATGSVADFLKVSGNGANRHQVKEAYFLIFNKGGNPVTGGFQAHPNTPFSLPDLTVIVEAKKGRAVQTIRFHSDRSKYYEGLKYSLYDTR